jgi:alcohol dehydrogenase class IV
MLDGPSLEELLHALGDGGAEHLELVSRGGGDGREVAENVVHAIEKQHVKVEVERQVAPEPLHRGDAARAWVEDAERMALVAIPTLDHAS